MRLARQLHTYFTVFFAPTIIFFAFSGFLQTYSLHEGDNPQPWMAAMGEIHKNQRIPPAKPQNSAGRTDAPIARGEGVSKGEGAARTEGVPSDAAGNASTPKTGDVIATRPNGASSASAAQSTPPRPQRRKKSVPLKIFMGFMSVGLISASLVGIWMSFQLRKPALILALLLAGTIIPIVALYAGM